MDDHPNRQLEAEMLEAEHDAADMGHVEKDPLLIILWRLNHQDKTLESMLCDLNKLSRDLADHIVREDNVKESIDEMVSLWKGSKLVGRILTWVVGIAAAIAGAYATLKKWV